MGALFNFISGFMFYYGLIGLLVTQVINLVSLFGHELPDCEAFFKEHMEATIQLMHEDGRPNPTTIACITGFVRTMALWPFLVKRLLKDLDILIIERW